MICPNKLAHVICASHLSPLAALLVKVAAYAETPIDTVADLDAYTTTRELNCRPVMLLDA